MRPAVFLIINLFILTGSPAWSAPPKPRPLAGIGILFVKADKAGQKPEIQPVALYRDPGIGRLADLDVSDFPSMAQSVTTQPGVHPLAVTRKKDDWVKVIFDDSGREGWLFLDPDWDFRTWDSYLRGGEVRLLNGLRKEFYQLRPSPSAPATGTVSREKKLRVIDLDDSWMLVLVEFSNDGWLRWKDDDGRLLISVNP